MHSLIEMEAPFTGLSSAEVESLRQKWGKNSYLSSRGKGLFPVLWNIVKEPMFLLLLTACLLYFILHEPAQGLLMAIAIGFVSAISLYQEIRSSKALSKLKKLTEPKVKCMRDGSLQVIASEELVPGDVMVLGEGERIPADALILKANDLSIDESTITGESVPVEKGGLAPHNELFQGTTINTGMCYARVTGTGNETVLGKLGRSIESIPVSPTLLQVQINRFVRIMAVFGITAFLTIWLVNYLHTGSIPESLLLGLTLAMSAIPEEMPVTFSSFMALGSFRMARLGIIATQPATLENLGRVSVLCLDKTGTITENKMQVSRVYDFRSGIDSDLSAGKPPASSPALWFARLASEAEPFDVMEKAIVASFSSLADASRYQSLRMVHEYPLEGKPPMMTHVYEEPNQGKTLPIRIVAAKGAPERILQVCRLDPALTDDLTRKVAAMASSGYRVLGVCSAPWDGADYPESQNDFEWRFEGLIALNDPPKREAGKVFAEWGQAGIGIKILSGDYAETILNIARQTGIAVGDHCATGEEVNGLTTQELQELAGKVNIFARMFPDAKLKVVNALKANGEIVAMTGDGVNDGPALQSAQIGIAMGERGTEIAREAADLVISDDDLAKITEAIRQGRMIHSNLKKAIRYLMSIHIPIIFTASLPLLLGWRFPTIFSPIHVIFLELIMGPTCSIFYEREPAEPHIMTLPPRAANDSLFRKNELPITLGLGASVTLGLLGLYYYFMQRGYSLEYTRSVVFITILISNVFLTFAGRSFRETFITTTRYRNNLVPYILGLSGFFLFLICFVPFARDLFRLTSINGSHWLLALATALLSVGWFEAYKGLVHRSRPAPG
ncbi:MAG: cation-translocating P-type ATPase [Bacteroidota bacterium]|nr:cation-translocating P-type ATPase [Bacteroidota bacterium]